MKKGLAMLVTALMVLSTLWLVGTASAATPESAIGTAAEANAMVIFGAIVTIGVGLFIAMNQKKGHTSRRPGRSAKALSSAVVLAMIVANAQHTRKVEKRGIVTPKINEKQYTLITIPDE